MISILNFWALFRVFLFSNPAVPDRRAFEFRQNFSFCQESYPPPK